MTKWRQHLRYIFFCHSLLYYSCGLLVYVSWCPNGLPIKWCLRNKCRNSIPVTFYYLDLGSNSDWSKKTFISYFYFAPDIHMNSYMTESWAFCWEKISEGVLLLMTLHDTHSTDLGHKELIRLGWQCILHQTDSFQT